MRKLSALLAVFVLLLSMLNFPVIFSRPAFAQETQGSSGSTSTTSGGTTTQTTTTETTSGTTATGGTGGTSSSTTTGTTTGTTETQTTTETTASSTTATGGTGEGTTETRAEPAPSAETAPTTEEKPLPPIPTLPPTILACPAPPQPPVCGENQGLKTKFGEKDCVAGYECEIIPKEAVRTLCPEVPEARITCGENEQLGKAVDEKGCVTGFNCIPTTSVQETRECPRTIEKPACVDSSVSPVFDKGCLVSYVCVPKGCSQEVDSSGFVRVMCEQKRVCPADGQQAELTSRCTAEGGNPIPFQDQSGCTFYDCRFDNRESKPNPIGGYSSCPRQEEVDKIVRTCKESGLTPSINFEGGCKIVKCSEERREERSCRFVPGPERERIESECESRGLPAISATDANGCQYFKCADSKQMTCQRDVPSEAYKSCNMKGGEMIVKTDNNGCIVFSQCVSPGDENRVSVAPVEEVPDTTVLLALALKLEQLKIELQKLASESNEISKYYASTGSVDEERYKRVSSMFGSAADKIDDIKAKLRDGAETMTKDDLVEIKYDIKYIKEVVLKDILYMMLSNSDDVKETLESSKKISIKGTTVEELKNAKDCGTDGYCFDKAIRSCKPVAFQPEGKNGPVVTITGLDGEKCVLHITMQSSDKVPPGYTLDSFYMDCKIKDYALGVRGPEDIIPNCEGPMAKFAKQFGGASEVSGGDTFQDIIEKEGGPGGCETEKECANYCVENYDDCNEWVEEHPAVGTLPSKAELRRFASGQIESVGRGETKFAGPGGCTGPEECDKFCRTYPDKCLEWCDENPGKCPQEKARTSQVASGALEQSQEIKCPDGVCDEFERKNPSACPQDCGGISQKTQPSGVQACVGCLNNGICDIGECSECIDCLRGERSITGEIVRWGAIK